MDSIKLKDVVLSRIPTVEFKIIFTAEDIPEDFKSCLGFIYYEDLIVSSTNYRTKEDLVSDIEYAIEKYGEIYCEITPEQKDTTTVALSSEGKVLKVEGRDDIEVRDVSVKIFEKLGLKAPTKIQLEYDNGVYLVNNVNIINLDRTIELLQKSKFEVRTFYPDLFEANNGKYLVCKTNDIDMFNTHKWSTLYIMYIINASVPSLLVEEIKLKNYIPEHGTWIKETIAKYYPKLEVNIEVKQGDDAILIVYSYKDLKQKK